MREVRRKKVRRQLEKLKDRNFSPQMKSQSRELYCREDSTFIHPSYLCLPFVYHLLMPACADFFLWLTSQTKLFQSSEVFLPHLSVQINFSAMNVNIIVCKSCLREDRSTSDTLLCPKAVPRVLMQYKTRGGQVEAWDSLETIVVYLSSPSAGCSAKVFQFCWSAKGMNKCLIVGCQNIPVCAS